MCANNLILEITNKEKASHNNYAKCSTEASVGRQLLVNYLPVAQSSQSVFVHFWYSPEWQLTLWEDNTYNISIYKELSTRLTYVGVRHDDHYISVRCEDVNEGGKARVSDFHTLELGLEFTGTGTIHHTVSVSLLLSTSSVTYLQLNLNCLTMLLIFSNRWTSEWGFRTEWAMTWTPTIHSFVFEAGVCTNSLPH